ncbi:TPA: hypothetical protein N0F65_007880 [Lagenidium giganteum]|uniref:Uncharacterized protein n=1 Tax=Lagenidium giganteum TaxID=4803 RepID=A0AAV2YYZ4_9STRA|nr:TPA: hypothetical protein N0F65_007880 [Lagenidium giganteum]
MRALGDPAQKRSPLMCGYPSKKCWNWRVEKRNGELHKFCQYHREKANENQRRMEQRRKNGTPRGRSGSSNTQADAKSNAATAKEVTVKTERKSDGSSKTSPRSVDCIPSSLSDIFDLPENAALPFACDMDIDMDLSVDLAPTYMMTDETIEGEPSDLPVDLYEEDLFFLERFIAEISHGGI